MRIKNLTFLAIVIASMVICMGCADKTSVKGAESVTEDMSAVISGAVEGCVKAVSAQKERIEAELPSFEEPQRIRCTGYCDYGYTKSGQYVREGIVAGKEEWLGKEALLWSIGEDGSIGEFLGYYEFLDTGYGINGSLKDGTSIDVWFPSEEAVWEWMSENGDYVYLQMIDGRG